MRIVTTVKSVIAREVSAKAPEVEDSCGAGNSGVECIPLTRSASTAAKV